MTFIDFKAPLHIFKSIYNGDVTLEDIEKEQIKLKSGFRSHQAKSPKIDQENKRRQYCYESRGKSCSTFCSTVVQLFNDYVKNMSKNMYDSKKEQGLKILTPDQMLKRLPIALKAGNNNSS